MASSGGIKFRELMIGGFALGETEPAAGEREGARANTFLALHANAAIPDLQGFLDDPEHTGQLTGHLRYAPLGEVADLGSGQFKLFVRARNSREKSMFYQLRFQGQQRPFCLIGTKSVQQRLLRSWDDTTTLYCRMHEGQDETGAVVGAGTLHLYISQFIRQLASFRTLNASSFLEKTRALADFGKFFAGELIDSYLG